MDINYIREDTDTNSRASIIFHIQSMAYHPLPVMKAKDGKYLLQQDGAFMYFNTVLEIFEAFTVSL